MDPSSKREALPKRRIDEFLVTDAVVVGAPMYYFSIPTQLNAWIDRILIAGKTFRYEATGPEGLVGEKRVIVALACGGFYGADTPAPSMEHLETYLRTAFNFIGIEPEVVAADGVIIGPDQNEAALAQARDEAMLLAA